MKRERERQTLSKKVNLRRGHNAADLGIEIRKAVGGNVTVTKSTSMEK